MSLIQTLKEDLSAAFKNGSTLIQLIVINVLVFLFVTLLRLILPVSGDSEGILGSLPFIKVLSWIAAPLNALDFIQKPYTILSYQFIHLDPLHLLGNMVFLYFFGSILESYVGNKKTLSLYLYGGIFGGLTSMLVCTFIPNADNSSPIIGASASVAAIAVATAAVNPRHSVRMMLFGPVQIYVLVLIFLLLNIISVSSYLNFSSSLSHLGGAVLGYFFIDQSKKGNDLSSWLNKLIEKTKILFARQKLKVSHIDHTKKTVSEETKKRNEKIEIVLTKIKRSGYDSLSKEEKDYLFQHNKN